MDMVLFSDMFGPVCVANMLALMFCFPSISRLCEFDLYERTKKKINRIYPGKWSFLFFTYSEEKKWYPKKTIVLELITYGMCLVTLCFSTISIFLKDSITLNLSLVWFMIMLIFYGSINSISGSSAHKY